MLEKEEQLSFPINTIQHHQWYAETYLMVDTTRLKLSSFTRFNFLSCLFLYLCCHMQLLLNILFYCIHVLSLSFSAQLLSWTTQSAGKDQLRARHFYEGNKWINIIFEFRTFKQLTVTILLFKSLCCNYKTASQQKANIRLGTVSHLWTIHQILNFLQINTACPSEWKITYPMMCLIAYFQDLPWKRPMTIIITYCYINHSFGCCLATSIL